MIETGRKECPIGILTVSREKTSLDTPEARIYACGPLLSSVSWTPTQREILLSLLQTRYLPYWSASPVASLRSHLISKATGDLVIAIEGSDGI